MGALFSRKKKSTIEVLEDLERDINRLETERRHTEIRQKRCIAKLTLGLVLALAVLLAYGLYEHWPTHNWEWLAAAVITALCFIPVFLTRLLARLIYTKRIEWKDETLADMREQRKDILDNVKETETFKVAMEILEKYDPKTKMEKQAREQREIEDKERAMMQRMQLQQRQITPAQVRQRNVPQQPRAMGATPSPVPPAPTPQQQQRPPPPGPLSLAVVPMTSSPMPPPNAGYPPGGGGGFPIAPQMQMARPILPKDRTPMDKVVDYLLGDGPSNRYALICSQCHSHNGMSLREEFEFLAFRCCFCFAFNPARRQRPSAPGLVGPGDRSASVMHLQTDDSTFGNRDRSYSENDLSADLLPIEKRLSTGTGGSTSDNSRSITPDAEVTVHDGLRHSQESIHIDDPVQNQEPNTVVQPDSDAIDDEDDENIGTPRIARIVADT